MSLDPAASAGIRPEDLINLLDRVGYVADPDYFTDPFAIGILQSRHAVEAAFDTMGVVGALCVGSHLGSGARTRVPLVYVMAARDDVEADVFHRAIWSQSLVPLVLIATPQGFQVRNGFDFRGGRGAMHAWSSIDGEEGLRTLSGLRSATIRSATSWSNFALSPKSRIDTRLYDGIRALSVSITSTHDTLKDKANVINSLVGRFLYFYVLIDRKALSQGWIDGLKFRGRPACPDVVLDKDSSINCAAWPREQVWRLFDGIDAVLNGSIFPITKSERAMLDDDVIDVVRRVLRSDRISPEGLQFGFLDVNYAAIRTETISAIYELFFDLEAGSTKDEDGAFYTPPYLVDYVLDELDAIRPFDASSIVVDPAAGSGAFLVGAFRRIIERERSKGTELSSAVLRKILVGTIHGTEIKPQAANVARFGLYLTMLDYLPEVNLSELQTAAKADGNKLFPDMAGNLVARDVFMPLPKQMRKTATHVVGNPPWTKAQPGSPADCYGETLARECPVTRSNLAELFFWRVLNDISKDGTAMALVLPTKSFIAPKATRFPTALMEAVQVRGITNLAHFRRRLFQHAEAAATVVFGSAGQVDPFGWTWRYSPLLANQPLSADGYPWAIVVDRGNVERTRQVDVARDGRWFRALMLQPLDRSLAVTLDDRISLGGPIGDFGNFLDANGLFMSRGASSGEAGIDQRFLLNATDRNYVDRLGLTPGSDGGYALPESVLDRAKGRYRRLFAGPVLLFPRGQSRYDVVDRPVGFVSTLTGLAFSDDTTGSGNATAVLGELAAFLRSHVARYLMALYGRLWVFDQRRFENDDMGRMPFPYASIDDLLEHPVSSMDEDAFTGFFADRFGLDEIFLAAVREHHELREGAQNGKRPPVAGLHAVSDAMAGTYIRVVHRQLKRMLGSTIEASVGAAERHRDGLAYAVTIVPDRDASKYKPHNPSGQTAGPITFGEQSTITVVEGPGTTLSMTKPDMAAAWTVERAFADAANIVRRAMHA